MICKTLYARPEQEKGIESGTSNAVKRVIDLRIKLSPPAQLRVWALSFRRPQVGLEM